MGKGAAGGENDVWKTEWSCRPHENTHNHRIVDILAEKRSSEGSGYCVVYRFNGAPLTRVFPDAKRAGKRSSAGGENDVWKMEWSCRPTENTPNHRIVDILAEKRSLTLPWKL